jgi:hypothetical protein
VTDVALAALKWEPQIKGGLYVLLAVLILVGSAYLLLSTNTGARLGFLLTAAGLFGFLTTMGIIWWVYAIGPVGRAPTWKSEGIVSGALASSRNPVLEDFPSGWKRLQPSDPQVADAQPIVDAQIVSAPGQRRMFASANDFQLIGAFEKGGDAFGPFGLNFRPLNVFHEAHYLTIQVQRVIRAESAPEQAPPRPQVDPTAQPVAVVMVRDLGTERLNPAVFTISSAALFLLICHQLHTRDKQAAARRESESEARTPEPVR